MARKDDYGRYDRFIHWLPAINIGLTLVFARGRRTPEIPGMSNSTTDFHGVWSLADWTVTLADGVTERRPFGGNVDGYLIYHPQGWVSASLMEREREEMSQDRLPLNALRREVKHGIQRELQAEELQHLRQYFLAAQGYISYTGTFDNDDACVHHRVRTSLIPQWVGTTLTRNYTFSDGGNVLTLLAEQEDARDCLVWQRQS